MNHRPIRVTVLTSCLLIVLSTTGSAQNPAPEFCSNVDLPATTPSNRFTILSGGNVIRHEDTGLEWQRCSIGQSWDGVTCNGNSSGYTWQEALGIAVDAGTDWRLPNIQELRSIVERCRYNPAINRKAFPNTPGSIFWSASPFAGGSSWGVSFIGGMDTAWDQGLGSRVRLVRGGH